MSIRLALALACLAALAAPAARAQEGERNACAACHERLQPGIVSDWRLSKHSRVQVGCEACHGTLHTRAEDAALARRPTPETCQKCHELQVAQFRRGKHARAWAAVKALPTFHHRGPLLVDDPTGCAECHRIGLKTEAETAALAKAGAARGMASCDACHTRHLFSPLEARQPEACKTCHGALQYDAWASSKHGTRHVLQLEGRLPSDAAAPTCQVCHLQNGDHGVRTPWGNLGLRLPLPEDEGWAADKRTLFVALGVLDAKGAEGPRFDAFQDAAIAHLDRIDYQNERFKLTQACRQCHAVGFIREQLDRRDGLVRKADALCARAVREVAALYDEGVLPKKGPGPFPDLVKAPAGAPVERRAADMIFDHRSKLMATAFHLSPESATWMSELERDFFEIEVLADQARAARAAPGKAGAPPKRP